MAKDDLVCLFFFFVVAETFNKWRSTWTPQIVGAFQRLREEERNLKEIEEALMREVRSFVVVSRRVVVNSGC